MSQRMPNGSTSEVLRPSQCGSGTISLRYQLAVDGCAESQLSLARGLLSEAVASSEERNQNAQVAVYWLLQAAGKGSNGALLLLRNCSYTGIGINCDNFFSVYECLKLTEEEVVARRVAYELFSAIMSDTEEAIAEELFQEKIQQILAEGKKHHEANASDSENNFKSPPQVNFMEFSPLKNSNPPLWQNISKEHLPSKVLNESLSESISKNSSDACAPAVDTTTNDPYISVADVVTSVQQCLEGSLPVVALKRVAQYEEYNKWFSLKYAHKLSNLFRSALILFLKDFGSVSLPLVVILCSIFLCMFDDIIPIDNSFTDIFLSSSICLVVMLSCSCYIIYLNVGLLNIERWLDLIKLFETNVKTNEVKQRYLNQTLYPLLISFASSFGFGILYPFNTLKLVSGELAILSILMLVLLDRTITRKRYFVNISLLLNVILCLSKGNFLNDLNFGLLSCLNFKVCLPFYGPYEIHLNWLSCFTLPFVLPYLYWKMAFGGEKRGWHLVLFPHFLCLTWLNVATNFYEASQQDDLFWGFCFWLVVLLCTSVIGTVPSLFIVSVAKYLYINGTWPSISMVGAVILCVAIISICSFFLKQLNKKLSYRLISSFLFIAFIFMVFMKTSVNQSPDSTTPVLPWEKYEMHCHRHAWYRSNTAEVEIACLPLKGKKIAVEGTVTAIDIINVQNRMNSFLSIFPSFVSQWLVCAFGEDLCSRANLPAFEKERCMLYSTMKINQCHLTNWDVYQYRIVIEVSSRTSPEVVLKADHSCSSFVRTLKEGDSLHTVGILHESIGSALPEILLQEATCTSCYANTNCGKLKQNKSVYDIALSVQHMINFYLSPFIQYRS